jgi:16S rRNA (guanine966-N2)-methyltransferase
VAAGRLRISGGTARGLPIVEPRGHRLRPTSGLVREALFNVIGDRVRGATVLDLFAGTGALGLEALSRGAAHVTFIEAAPAACQAILQSLARAGFANAGTVVRGRLPAALPKDGRRFDLIFQDPPYGEDAADATLLASGPLLAAAGTIVYEHGSRYNPPARPIGLQLTDRRVYGDSALAFYAHEEGE